MKRFIIICLVSFAAFGCTEFLEEKNYSSLTPENAIQSRKDIDNMLNGAYGWLRHGFDNKWAAGFGSIGTDEATSYNDIFTDHESMLDNYTYTSEYDWFSGVYSALYKGIKNCNIVINNMPASVSSDDAQMLIAQARFLRGTLYFELVNLFGGVPLWLTVEADRDKLELGRSSVEDVYGVIIEDLLYAESVLPQITVWTGDDVGRPTKYAARGMLARVYLQQLDYAKALEYCDMVIGQGATFHLDAYGDIFDPGKKNSGRENIFEIQNRVSMKSEDLGSTISDFYLPTQLQGTIYTGWAMWGPTDYLYNSYEQGDLRKDVTFFTSGIDNGGISQTFAPHCFKYHNRREGIPVNDGEQNFPLIRYADILLMKAEAINGLPAETAAQTTAKFDCLNQVRTRAGLGNVLNEGANATKEGFLETILLERLHEFCFEKSRRRDLIRNDKLVSYVSLHKPDRPVPDKARLYYPLPLSVTDANNILRGEQLAGY